METGAKQGACTPSKGAAASGSKLIVTVQELDPGATIFLRSQRFRFYLKSFDFPILANNSSVLEVCATKWYRGAGLMREARSQSWS